VVQPISLGEIREHEARLRKEIAERQSLLKAFSCLRESIGANDKKSDAELLVKSIPASTTESDVPNKNDWGVNTKLVRWAIGHMEGDFTSHDVARFLAEHDQRITMQQIASSFNRLVKRGEVKLLQRSLGQRPSRYRQNET